MTKKVARKVMVGSKFGKLTVVQARSSSYVEPSGKVRWCSVVDCECGEKLEIKNSYMVREPNPKCKKCEYNENCIVSIGSVFDNLTVIGYVTLPEYNNRKRCVCKCICGNTMTIKPESLLINKKNNCGCIDRSNKVLVGKLSKNKFRTFKQNAKSRNIPFDITMIEIWDIYQSQNGKCALTGLPISFGKRAIDTNSASPDRIDPTKGYTKDNIQWVHKDINYIKWDLQQDRFIELVRLISNFDTNKMFINDGSIGDYIYDTAYDKVEILGYFTENKKKMAICKCACGTIYNRQARSVVKNNKRNNCGCKPLWHTTRVGLISQTFFYRIKCGADLRKISFDLKIEDIWKKYQDQNGKCALTGLPIPFSDDKPHSPNEGSLDRIDSTRGYTIRRRSADRISLIGVRTRRNVFGLPFVK